MERKGFQPGDLVEIHGRIYHTDLAIGMVAQWDSEYDRGIALVGEVPYIVSAKILLPYFGREILCKTHYGGGDMER